MQKQTLSQMSAEDSKAHINALTAVETKKYVEPLLASHAEEKEKATNTVELMAAIAKEQAILSFSFVVHCFSQPTPASL